MSTMHLMLGTRTLLRKSHKFQVRQVTTKQIPWCTPKGSTFRNQNLRREDDDDDDNVAERRAQDDVSGGATFVPIDRFGIVAAMTSKSRVIGMNGKLPWDRLSRDRQVFENLTRDRILVVGRRTLLDEQPNLNHLNHAKCCIVVSTTLPQNIDELFPHDDTKDINDGTFVLKIARSFNEALHIAREIASSDIDNKLEAKETLPTASPGDSNDGDIPAGTSNLQCWVVGGERLYAEALNHESASELHLSAVDKEIDWSAASVERIARFPAKYRWDSNYQKIFETTFPPILDDDGTSIEPCFTYFVYDRVIRQRDNCTTCSI